MSDLLIGFKRKEESSKYRFMANYSVIDPSDNQWREFQYFTGKTIESARKQFDHFYKKILKKKYPYRRGKGYIIEDVYLYENPDYIDKEEKNKEEEIIVKSDPEIATDFHQFSLFDIL